MCGQRKARCWQFFGPTNIINSKSLVSEVKQSCIKVCHKNKFDQIEVFLDEGQPEVVVLSEYGQSDSQSKLFNISNYTLLSNYCRLKLRGGGV